jgi:hypothetical protein
MLNFALTNHPQSYFDFWRNPLNRRSVSYLSNCGGSVSRSHFPKLTNVVQSSRLLGFTKTFWLSKATEFSEEE